MMNSVLWKTLILLCCTGRGWGRGAAECDEMAAVMDTMTRVEAATAAMSSRLDRLEQELATKEERIADLEAEARTTQQEPAVFQCGFQDEFATGNAVIRFDRLTLDEQTGAGGLVWTR